MAHHFSKRAVDLDSADITGTNMSRSDILSNEVKNWQALWKSDDQWQPPPLFGQVETLPGLSRSDIYAAARSFKRSTCALSGFHPRHILLLPPGAVDCLLDIFHAMEQAGVLPHQLQQTQINLLNKQTGGTRPIAWYQSLFRVWARARCPLVHCWESNHASLTPFAATRGKSPIDIVWRHACAAELSQTNGSFFGAILWDILKCYEKVDHHLLVRAARRHCYPMGILRLSIASCRAPRRIVYKGLTSELLHAQCGILAGNCFATSELRLALLDAVNLFLSKQTRVKLNIYIDDLSLDVVRNTKSEMIQDLASAAEDLAFAIQDVACLPIAKSKSGVVSNSLVAARSLRKCLGDLGGPPVGSVRALGVDFWAAAPVKSKMLVRNKRFRDLAKRVPRLLSLRKVDPFVSSKVFYCGALPAAMFDAPIYGLFGPSLNKLRSLSANFKGVSGKKRSLDLCHSFNPLEDPEVLAAKALMLDSHERYGMLLYTLRLGTAQGFP